MALYTIKVDGKVMATVKRIDSAMRRFEAWTLTEGQSKEMLSEDGTVVARGGAPVAPVAPVAEVAPVKRQVLEVVPADQVPAERSVFATVAPEDAVVLQTLAESAAILEAAAPAPKAPKVKRAHNNGDEVAQVLHGLSIDQVGDLTRSLFVQACTLTRQGKKAPVNLLSPADCRRDEEAIEAALRRAKGIGEYDGVTKKANPGSGRMSLGLMIRKYVSLGVALVG